MNKKLFLDFVGDDSETCYIDVHAIQAIIKDRVDGRIAHSVVLLDYGHEISVEGSPADILQRIVQAASDNAFMLKYGFVPRIEEKGGK